jgi:predicted ester cyclase
MCFIEPSRSIIALKSKGWRRAPPGKMTSPTRHQTMSVEHNKALVVRLVEAVNRSDLDVIDQVAIGEIAKAARRWIDPFRQSFPNFTMEIVDLVAEGDKVVAHLWCSGTHEGEWQGIPATGRRFERVNEIYIFHVENGKLAHAVGVEDNVSRLRQLGIELSAREGVRPDPSRSSSF